MAKKLILILVALMIIVGAGFFIWREIYLPKSPGDTEKIIFVVEKGEGSKEISINLEKEELIKYGTLFRLYVLHKRVAVKLQAGKYLLSPSMNIPEIVKKFVSGDVIKEKFTIVEGWNIINIGMYFQEKGLFSSEEFFAISGYPMIDYSMEKDLPQPKDFSQDFACPVGSPQGDSCGEFLEDKPKNLGLEGYFFPDTYEVNKGETPEDIIRKILANFDKKLTPDLREEIKRQDKTIFEIITAASLVEKEVRSFEDRRIVAGIIEKRIKAKIPLQIDATIVYLTGKNTTKISIEETKIDSPYNTYKYLGLPPGPISNPGAESIRVVIFPKDSEYWYYLSKPSGETVFSRTLKEHNLAKEKYLK